MSISTYMAEKKNPSVRSVGLQDGLVLLLVFYGG